MRSILNLIFLLFLSLVSNLVLAQKSELNQSIYQNVAEPSIYKYYSESSLIDLWVYKNPSKKVAEIDTLSYGFFESCDLPHIDSLKHKGTYYFEIDKGDFSAADEESRKLIAYQNCGQLNLQKSATDTLMIIFYSSRQQYVTYRKIKSLPPRIAEYLRTKGGHQK